MQIDSQDARRWRAFIAAMTPDSQEQRLMVALVDVMPEAKPGAPQFTAVVDAVLAMFPAAGVAQEFCHG